MGANDFYDRAFKGAIQAAERGDWKAMIANAKLTPPSWDVWQQLPSASKGKELPDGGHERPGLPDDVVHEILNYLTAHPGRREELLPTFMYEYSHSAPEDAGPEVLNRIAEMAKDDGATTSNIHEHPNWKPDQRNQGLMDAGNFWASYERKVQPHHFAVVKSLYTRKPEKVRWHRGDEEGDSAEHMHLLPHMEEHAKLVRQELLQDAREFPWENDSHSERHLDTSNGPWRDIPPRVRIKHFNGEPHVQVFRGVNGDYAHSIATKAGMVDTPEGATVARKVLRIPVSHLGSWTIDKDMAKRFATTRSELPDQRKRALVLEKWLPLRNLLHSGFHTVSTNQSHPHKDESELIFGHPEGHVKVPTKNLHVVRPKFTGASDTDVSYHETLPVTVREPEPRAPKKAKAPAVEDVAKNEPMTLGPQHLEKLGKSEGNLRDSSHVLQAMLGHRYRQERALAAAHFLAPGKSPTPEEYRRALWEVDGDHDRAALLVHGLEIDDSNLRALRAVREVSDLGKAEVARARQVVAAQPEGRGAADAVRRAFGAGDVEDVKLEGKHSKGSMLAHDREGGKTYLLKPGSGPTSPIVGASEEPATQSEREAAWWHACEVLGMGGWYPRVDLLVIDGRQHAAIEMLPPSFHTMEDLRDDDPSKPATILRPYLKRTLLHRWAALDYLFGNGDDNAQNILADGHDEVRLIDHGSAFAGPDFEPAYDRSSFVPFCLRALAAPEHFNLLSPEEKLKVLPRLDDVAAAELREWLLALDLKRAAGVLERYRVHPAPSAARYQKLVEAAQKDPADLAILRAWTS